MVMKHLYTANANVKGGRLGHAKTDDNKLSVDLSRPGSSGSGTNPEQLFACGYGACFGSAVEAVAKKQNIDVGAVEVDVEVSLLEENGFFLSVVLRVLLPTLDDVAALKLVEAAHQVCPYSKATRGNIEVTLKVNGQE